MKQTLFLFITLLAVLSSCIEDSISSSPSDQPLFSTDTLRLGDNFTLTPTATARFKAYNRGSQILSISSVTLRESSQGTFRINVDGMAGSSFRDVEIRPGDSIYIFVEATFPPTGSGDLSEVNGYLDFLTNGVTSTVVLNGSAQDAERHTAHRVEAPGEQWSATLPHIIFDSLIVDPGATLTLPAGTSLYFHDKAYMKVYGSLITEGTPSRPVTLTGDRRGNVVGNIPFDLMASQWEGLIFAPASQGSRLSHTTVSNTVGGVTALTGSEVCFHNSRLRNSAGSALTAIHASVTLVGCEVAEAAESALDVTGGTLKADFCTFANYYLFRYPSAPIVSITHTGPADSDPLAPDRPSARALITRSIIYGLSPLDFSPASLDGTDIRLHACVLKSNGSDDTNFTACIWGADPDWGVVREDYIFDYRLAYGSPLHGTAPLILPADLPADLVTPPAGIDPLGADIQGSPRTPSPTPGAYQSPLGSDK